MRIKKPFAIALILTRATNIDFFFSNDILNAKRNVAVYEGHKNFRREVTKSSKFQSFQYWYLQISKIQTYHNPTKKFFKHLAHPIP